MIENFNNKLNDILSKFKKIELKLANQEKLDRNSLIALNKEYSDLNPLVEKINLYNKANKNILDLNDLLNDKDILIKNEAEKEIKETNTKIKQDLSVLSFFCDDVSMEQVFANIIENSIKYKNPDNDPEIIIKSWEEKEKIYISFKDNGIGIPEVIKSNVFSKDFRGEDSKNSNIDGYGLGLYHVKNLVMENKGSIEITDTKENEGTTITLCFLKDP